MAGLGPRVCDRARTADEMDVTVRGFSARAQQRMDEPNPRKTSNGILVYPHVSRDAEFPARTGRPRARRSTTPGHPTPPSPLLAVGVTECARDVSPNPHAGEERKIDRQW